MRVAIIGLGRWGRQLLRVFNSLADVVLCYNRSNEEAHVWLAAHYPQVAATFDLEEVWSSPDIDAVVIASPNETHAQLVADALNRGKHVFVEKPLATSTEEVVALYALANEVRRQLFVGLTFLYHPVLDELQRELLNDRISAIRMIWWKFGTFGESLFWNLLIHEAALLLRILGEPAQRLQPEVVSTRNGEPDLDAIEIRMHDSVDEVSVRIEVNRVMPFKKKLIMVVTESNRVLFWNDDQLVEFRSPSSQIQLFSSSVEPLCREVRSFLSGASGGTQADASFDLGVTSIVKRIQAATGSEPA